MLKRLIQDKKGSALVLSICLLAIIAILAVGMAGVTSMVYKKTTYDVNRQQAYFNAKSGIETALNSIVSQKDDALIQAIRNAGGTLVSDPIEFADGTYTLTLRLLNSDPDNPQLSVTATGEDHGKKYSISSKVEGSITRTKPPFQVTHALDMTGTINLHGATIEGGIVLRPGSASMNINSTTVKGDITAFAKIDDEGWGENKFSGNIHISGDNQLKGATSLTGNLYLAPGTTYNELKSLNGRCFFNQEIINPPIEPPPTSFDNLKTWNEVVDTSHGTPRLDVTKGDVSILVDSVNCIGASHKVIELANGLDIVYDPDGDNGNVLILMPGGTAEPLFSQNIGRLINKDGQAIDNEGNLVYYDTEGRPRKSSDGSLADVTPRLYIIDYADSTTYKFEDNCVYNGYLLTDLLNETKYVGFLYGQNFTVNGGLRGTTMTGATSPNFKVFYKNPKDGFTDGGGSSSTNASWSVGGFQKGDGK